MRRARWSPRSAWCGASCSCPGPAYGASENFNAGLPDRCTELATNRIGRRTRRNVACSPRPCGAAAVAREAFRRGHVAAPEADRYGVVTLEDGIVIPRTGRTRAEASWASARSRSRSSTRRASIWRPILGRPGRPGPARTARTRPCSWRCCATTRVLPNSRVRDALPDPLRNGWIGRTDRHATRRCRPSNALTGNPGGNAVEPMLSILESTGGADRAGVTLLAAGLAEGVAVSNTTMTGRI